MEIKEIKEKEEFIKLTNFSKVSFLQTWEWGNIKKGEWNSTYLNVDQTPVLILTKKIPFTKSSFGYIPRAFFEGVSSEIIRSLISFCKENFSLSHLIIEPNSFNNDDLKTYIASGLGNTGRTIQPNYTNIINLGKTEEELWQELDPKYRRSVNKSIRNECSVVSFSEGEEAVERFYKIMSGIIQKKKFSSSTFDYYKKVWNEFSSINSAKIFIVQHEGKDVGTYFVVYKDEFANELYGGVNEVGRNMRAGYVLKWESIKDARNQGRKYYDHWGVAKKLVDDYDKNDGLYNISHFKEGFGGNYTEYLPQFTYVFSKTSHSLFKLGQALNKLKLQIRKRV